MVAGLSKFGALDEELSSSPHTSHLFTGKAASTPKPDQREVQARPLLGDRQQNPNRQESEDGKPAPEHERQSDEFLAGDRLVCDT